MKRSHPRFLGAAAITAGLLIAGCGGGNGARSQAELELIVLDHYVHDDVNRERWGRRPDLVQ
jgi:hypothetical protein